MTVGAPFPYAGSKRRWAGEIWANLGNPEVYAEPFSGSLAVLLARPGGAGKKEVVCDLNGLICNFWRAVQSDPEAVAYHADWPTIHHDLTARHKHLVAWGRANAERLSDDPRWCDPELAGWWVWGISNWISPSTWCTQLGDSRPHPPGTGPAVCDSRPTIKKPGTGHRISSQRKITDGIPYSGWQPNCGSGVSRQRRTLPRKSPADNPSTRLVPWFHALADRLQRVVVLNRSWESCVTRAVLSDYPNEGGHIPTIGIFLDPPYLTEDRTKKLYASDHTETPDAAARESWAWALEHGDRYRIAYACYAGDFDAPDGWTVSTRAFSGVSNPKRRATRRDCVMYSPACVPPARLL